MERDEAPHTGCQRHANDGVCKAGEGEGVEIDLYIAWMSPRCILTSE